METVSQALQQYLDVNKFTTDDYTKSVAKVYFFKLPLWIPNTKARQRAIAYHDLHHVVTGYKTDLIGEAEISAFELRRGLRGAGLYIRFLVCGVTALGMVLAPKRVVAAYKKAGTGDSLFRHDDYANLLTLSVAELREKMNVPSDGFCATTQSI